MYVYRIRRGATLEGLERVEVPPATLGPNEVRIEVRAVALNYRDVAIANGHMGPRDRALIPGSDAVGIVAAVGAHVSRVRVGERVITSFFPHWIDGPPTTANTSVGFGGGIDGLLAEEAIVPEHALVAAPASLSDMEASTMPCAGVTAWHALFEATTLQRGDSVLLLGTGGVSIWALQLAKAAGLRVLITSSDDTKLARARMLGADATINYRTQPEWQHEVLRLTDGRGVDLVLETGGQGTLQRSVEATRVGGTIAVIGAVSGAFGAIDASMLLDGAKTLAGILVGSRAMAEALARFVETHRIKPVIDRVFAFDDARDAYRFVERGAHFGKVVIAVAAETSKVQMRKAS